MTRLLVVDVKWPRPRADASSQRTLQLVNALAELGFDVDLAAMFPEETGGETEVPIELGAARRLPVAGGDALLEHLARHARDYAVALVCWTRTAQAVLGSLRAAAPELVVCFDTQDVNHVREYRHARVTGNVNLLRRALAMKQAELGAVADADFTLAISDHDAATLRAGAPSARIEVVTMSVERRQGLAPGPDGRRGAVYLGNYMAWHNVDAATYLCTEIVPLLAARGENLPITLAGAGRHELIDRLASPQVTVSGYVDDVIELFDRQRIFVAPLRVGSGVKGKLLAALAAGLPIVATQIAAEGVPLVHDESALLAESPAEFATAIVRLERDDELWRALSAGGQAVVAEHFSRELVQRQVRNVFAPLLEAPAHQATAAAR